MAAGAGLADTDPEAERVQLELLRAASPARRAALACRLSDQVRHLALRALRRAHPGAGDDEIKVLFARVHFGDELADGLARDLAARRG